MVSNSDRRDPASLVALRGAPGLPVTWVEDALTLTPHIDPCPGFRDGQWARTYGHLVNFLAGTLAVEAVTHGWPTELLFGVHPTVGIVRVDCCGACILADPKPIIAVEHDVIRFEGATFYRPKVRNLSIPVWQFGQPTERIAPGLIGLAHITDNQTRT